MSKNTKRIGIGISIVKLKTIIITRKNNVLGINHTMEVDALIWKPKELYAHLLKNMVIVDDQN